MSHTLVQHRFRAPGEERQICDLPAATAPPPGPHEVTVPLRRIFLVDARTGRSHTRPAVAVRVQGPVGSRPAWAALDHSLGHGLIDRAFADLIALPRWPEGRRASSPTDDSPVIEVRRVPIRLLLRDGSRDRFLAILPLEVVDLDSHGAPLALGWLDLWEGARPDARGQQITLRRASVRTYVGRYTR